MKNKQKRQSMIIIGAGMGGLAAGVYGQMNGYRTEIFELHTLPGGQCTAWKRQGYTFDACIHHLFGCAPGSPIYDMWQEMGAMPRELVMPQECTSVSTLDGKMFVDYYDSRKLEEHMNKLSPNDSKVIHDYVKGIQAFTKHDTMAAMFTGKKSDILKLLPGLFSIAKWMKPTMQQVADRFEDPFLQKAFPLLVYSMPDSPAFLHLARHGYGNSRNIQWPVGGALEFSQSIAKKYESLGGKIHYRARVAQIIVENDKAMGVKLTDGTEHQADIVISNADGRRTIMDMLGGKYVNDQVRESCGEPPDESMMAVSVYLGVKRDLTKEPSAMILLLDKPEMIAGHEHKNLEMQLFGFDKTMAPARKGVIKVELHSKYSYWKQLHEDRAKYKAEKDQVTEQVIAILERRFPGLRNQIEVKDVTTLVTWERYMGGTHGWTNMPKRKFTFSIIGNSGKEEYDRTLPGLANFYFCGVWATNIGALFMNAQSGKKIVQAICKEDGIKFAATTN